MRTVKKVRPSREGRKSRSVLKCPIDKAVEDLHRKLANDRSGEVATYIPELGRANPDWFGVCVVTADGKTYEAGDTDQSFTIQSISKPFLYGMALEDNGQAAVLEKIWMEPSGEAFNAISLRPGSGQPANPMINAGAIATTSLVSGVTTQQKMRRILDGMGRYAGRPLSIDEAVYRSESETGHRNRAIAYMLRNFNIIESDPMPGLEAYFMQCSLAVTCRDLGVMAATLANQGVNPITKDRAVVREYVESILSVMSSCGMYDGAGEWIYRVGMPAKSGVAGGILAVLPGQLGIGVFSPRLDACGNSVRGVKFCLELSRRFGLHMFNAPRVSASVLRRITHVGEVSSNRCRCSDETDLLKRHGSRVTVVFVQGVVVFASSEVVIRELMKRVHDLDGMILDLQHVQAMDFVTRELLAELALLVVRAGKFMSFSHAEHMPKVTQAFRKKLKDRIQFFGDLDLALEDAENRILARHGWKPATPERIDLAECEIAHGMSRQDVEALKALLRLRLFRSGDVIIQPGEDASEMCVLTRGTASVWLHSEESPKKRVATFTPGMIFGEVALLDRQPRSAQVTADTDVELLSLDAGCFDGLTASHPNLQRLLLRNLSQILARRLRATNRDLGAV